MDKTIRSMSTFTFGMMLVATGLAAALADGTDLDFAPTASVAALGAAVVILVAAAMAPKGKKASAPERPSGGESKPEGRPESEVDEESESESETEREPDFETDLEPEQSG